MTTDRDSLESLMLGNLARPVWGWGPGATPGPTPLFAGSLAGGERNAGFLSLVSSAHRNDLDIWAYVDDVLKRLLAGETNYESLLPWNWAQDHPQAIRTYRQHERRDREIRKREQRQRRRANQRRQAKLNRR